MSAADTLIVLCSTDQVTPGEAIRVVIDGYPPLAVFNLNGAFHVTDDRCTHGDASLAEGEIDCDDGVVECPWHQGAFDIATGKPCGAPCTIPLRVYQVVVRDGVVLLAQ